MNVLSASRDPHDLAASLEVQVELEDVVVVYRSGYSVMEMLYRGSLTVDEDEIEVHDTDDEDPREREVTGAKCSCCNASIDTARVSVWDDDQWDQGAQQYLDALVEHHGGGQIPLEWWPIYGFTQALDIVEDGNFNYSPEHVGAVPMSDVERLEAALRELSQTP